MQSLGAAARARAEREMARARARARVRAVDAGEVGVMAAVPGVAPGALQDVVAVSSLSVPQPPPPSPTPQASLKRRGGKGSYHSPAAAACMGSLIEAGAVAWWGVAWRGYGVGGMHTCVRMHS